MNHKENLLAGNLEGLRVLVDGFQLENIKGTGLKVYGITLLQALQRLGADANVLFSKYSLRSDRSINTDVLALFQPPIHSWYRFNWSLLAKSMVGLPTRAKAAYLPGDLVITQASNEFNFIKDVGLYSCPGCHAIAERLEYFGMRVRIKTEPNPDIWHATYFTPIVVKGAAKVTTVHDLVPLRLPHATLSDKGVFLHHVRDAVKTSQIILSVSEHTKRDLVEFIHIDPDRIHVTYQPVRIHEYKPDDGAIQRRLRMFGLERKEYILFVGAIEPKKNLRRLIEAYLSIDTEMPLIVVGKKAWLWEDELAPLSREGALGWHTGHALDRVRLFDFLSLEDVASLLVGARCLAFPSLYEGFGLPPLEAMSLGCPVLTSHTSSLPEICGDAAIYVDPYDTLDIADKLQQLISDNALCSRLSAAGRKRAKEFSMDRYAERLAKAYLSL